jgi:hypothetical protein
MNSNLFDNYEFGEWTRELNWGRDRERDGRQYLNDWERKWEIEWEDDNRVFYIEYVWEREISRLRVNVRILNSIERANRERDRDQINSDRKWEIVREKWEKG